MARLCQSIRDPGRDCGRHKIHACQCAIDRRLVDGGLACRLVVEDLQQIAASVKR